MNPLPQKIIKNIYSKNKLIRYIQVLIGVLLLAIAFNLFFFPRKIIYGGVSGLAIIMDFLFHFDPAIFILIANLILIIISFIVLGKDKTYKSLFVAIIFPITIHLTTNITNFIDLSDADTLTVSLFGAVVAGFSSGLIYKAGYTTAGTDILSQILLKSKRLSMGKAILLINIIIIFLGTWVTNWTMALYAIIILYIISVISDKVMLGISNNKAFYIITTKEKEITNFILDNLGHGVTILNAYGGFTGEHAKVLMCVIPTREYFKLKESIHEIDKEAFFLVTDAYEVHGAE